MTSWSTAEGSPRISLRLLHRLVSVDTCFALNETPCLGLQRSEAQGGEAKRRLGERGIKSVFSSPFSEGTLSEASRKLSSTIDGAFHNELCICLNAKPAHLLQGAFEHTLSVAPCNIVARQLDLTLAG